MKDTREFILKDDNGKPIWGKEDKWYGELLFAFGLGPFTYLEAKGALQHAGQHGADVDKIIDERLKSGTLIQIR